MSHIRQEYLDMAYRVVSFVNLQGKVCNHIRFHNVAFKLYFQDIQKRPVLVEYLGRALRELPKCHPDIERVGKDAYIVRQLRTYCEKHWLKERLRRIGGSNGFMIDEEKGAAQTTKGDQKEAAASAINHLVDAGKGEKPGGAAGVHPSLLISPAASSNSCNHADKPGLKAEGQKSGVKKP